MNPSSFFASFKYNQYIGAHSDDEKDIIRRSPIITISLGETRTFRITPKREAPIKKNSILDLPLVDGTIAIMSGRFQSEFKHAVPKQPSATGRRISITIRKFK